jgi:hypothetical protein
MSKIFELLKEKRLFDDIDVNKPPKEVTLEMLKKEMDNTDFIPDINLAWTAWCDTMNITMYKKENNILLEIYEKLRKQPAKENIRKDYKSKNHLTKIMKYSKSNINRNNSIFSTIRQQGGNKKKRKTNKLLKRKNKTYKKRGGNHSFESPKIIEENYNDANNSPHKGFSKLWKPQEKLFLYGMQLPNQFDRLKMFQMLAYLIYVKNIKVLVDLQGCPTETNEPHPTVPKRGCNKDPNFKNSEPEIMKGLTYLSGELVNNPHMKYLNCGIKDMKPGRRQSWDSIFNIPDTAKSENATVVHCLAGFGRTGSVLLYLMLRDVNYHISINEPFFGGGSSKEAIRFFRSLFENNPHVGNELFDTSENWKLELLITRINHIIFLIAKKKNAEVFYLYFPPVVSQYSLEDSMILSVYRKVSNFFGNGTPMVDDSPTFTYKGNTHTYTDDMILQLFNIY